MKLKRVISVVMLLALLVFATIPCAMGASKNWYQFIPTPPFVEDETQEIDPAMTFEVPEEYSAEIVRVKPSWTLVNREAMLWQVISCHRGVDKLSEVILTDCLKTVRADVRATGYSMIEVTFLTRELKGFDTSHGVYMIFVYKN